jgi:DNA recombination protein Rad52
MSGFNANQVRALSAKLDRRHVQSRKGQGGRDLSYVEGWFVISEANAIFGFGGWDRETVHFEKVFERSSTAETACGYLTRVRIRVRAGRGDVTREGTGFGSATSKHRAEAHEMALKGAETDATKRALATFGNRFGLALYDKEQAGVTGEEPAPYEWKVFDLKGVPVITALSPEGYCSALRQIIEQTPILELASWHDQNRAGMDHLRAGLPHLTTKKGTHYSDILTQLIERRIEEELQVAPALRADEELQGPLAPSKIANGVRIDKSALLIGTERRIRDKAHLKSLSAHPCLICARQPSHAHHLTFAQRRGLSQKVSDEFVVPLCALHHGDLHHARSERDWWENVSIDPLPIAAALWARHRQSGSDELGNDEPTPTGKLGEGADSAGLGVQAK